MFVHLVIGNISLAGLLACLVAVEICLRVISLVVRLWRQRPVENGVPRSKCLNSRKIVQALPASPNEMACVKPAM